MLVRNYKVENFKDSYYFCPVCHRKLELPFKGNINIQSAISLNCSLCKKGRVKIEVIKKELVNG